MCVHNDYINFYIETGQVAVSGTLYSIIDENNFDDYLTSLNLLFVIFYRPFLPVFFGHPRLDSFSAK